MLVKTKQKNIKWKEASLLKSSKWKLESRARSQSSPHPPHSRDTSCPRLLSFCPQISVFFPSNLMTSLVCLFAFSSPAWTDMCSLTTATTSPSGANSAPLNRPMWVAWRATCIKRTQVSTHKHTHTHTFNSHSAGVSRTNTVVLNQSGSLVLIVLHLKIQSLVWLLLHSATGFDQEEQFY